LRLAILSAEGGTISVDSNQDRRLVVSLILSFPIVRALPDLRTTIASVPVLLLGPLIFEQRRRSAILSSPPPPGEHPMPDRTNQKEPAILGREEKQGGEVQDAEGAHG
jgi:hypothetical protein